MNTAKCVTSNSEKAIYRDIRQKGLTKLMFAATAQLNTHLSILRELTFFGRATHKATTSLYIMHSR